VKQGGAALTIVTARVALALAVACGAGAWTWLVVGTNGPRRDVPAPPTSASPADVVRAYVDAVAARDCATARDLWRSPAGGFWCEDADTMDDLRVTDTFEENPRWSAHRPGQQVMNVSATIDMGEGRQPWGYVLVRDTPADPWRILDQGMG
jgi:hypothetical protein